MKNQNKGKSQVSFPVIQFIKYVTQFTHFGKKQLRYRSDLPDKTKTIFVFDQSMQ
jgi:hypothetical protein